MGVGVTKLTVVINDTIIRFTNANSKAGLSHALKLKTGD